MAFDVTFHGLKILYEHIVDNVEGIGAFKWCDFDFGQTEHKEQEYSIEYPAVLIKFDNVIWQSPVGDGSLKGVATVSFKVMCQHLNEHDWLLPFQVRGEVITFYDLLGMLHNSRLDLTSDHYSKLRLFNQFHVKTPINEMIWVEILQYRTNIQTNGAIEDPSGLVIEFEKLREDNDFIERNRLNKKFL